MEDDTSITNKYKACKPTFKRFTRFLFVLNRDFYRIKKILKIFIPKIIKVIMKIL